MFRNLTAACLLLSIGCRNSTDVAGLYTLQAVDGAAVPRIVYSTVFCDELVLSGRLHLAGGGVFDLSFVQSQDCTRNGAGVDTFTTTMTGTYAADRAQVVLQVAQPDTLLTATSSGGVVELPLPQLPLLGGGAHSGRFVRVTGFPFGFVDP